MQSIPRQADRRAAAEFPSHRFLAVLATLILLFLSFVAPVEAQQTEATEYSQAELQAFAVASLKIEEINQEWRPHIDAARTTEEEEALRRQAMSEMTEAVRQEGLTVTEYNKIFEAAQKDPEVAELIDDYRETLR